MQVELDLGVERRVDYTFKYNSKLGRHGWLRLTPAYSVKLVKEIILRDCKKDSLILEPFSGTATTGLAAAELGFNTVLLEINPFLVWFGNLKCATFTEEQLNILLDQFKSCLDSSFPSGEDWIPPIHNIERWWHPHTIKCLSGIRKAIVNSFGEPQGTTVENLVWVAFARLVIETSSAAFDHVSMSFKENSAPHEFEKIKKLLSIVFTSILNSARQALPGVALVKNDDSRDLSRLDKEKFDTVITSPPYPNRMSYIRELRPYMYWLKFLSNSNDASVLDWKAIGGTWGTATSNLKNWLPKNNALPQRLYNICESIAGSGDKNSKLMSLYVHKYFDDMLIHLRSLKSVLSVGAKINYIIGNSSFYGHFVESDKILSDILYQEGYSNVIVDVIRKRNTKKGLLEFNIRATY